MGERLAEQRAGVTAPDVQARKPDAADLLKQSIRAWCAETGANPTPILKRLEGSSEIARWARWAFGETAGAAISSDQQVGLLYEKLAREGLAGRKREQEMCRQLGKTPDAVKRSLARYNKHRKTVPAPGSIEQLFSPGYSADKKTRKRGRKPRAKGVT
jgi:hypothetical protein